MVRTLLRPFRACRILLNILIIASIVCIFVLITRHQPSKDQASSIQAKIQLVLAKILQTKDGRIERPTDGIPTFTATESSKREEKVTNYSIPMIIHQTYANEMIRSEYKECIADCLRLNPKWEYYLWRDEDIEAFVMDHFPWLWKKMKSFRMSIERADLIRYMALYHYGGIYVDMDVQCLQPFYPSLESVGPAFLDQERKEHAHILYGLEGTAMNSVMGSVPRHPFFQAVLEAVNSAPESAPAPAWTTGPFLLTSVYRRWIHDRNQSAHPVTRLEPEVFSPLLDVGMNDFPRLCSRARMDQNAKLTESEQWTQVGCLMLVKNGWKVDTSNPNTIGKHRFFHFGWGPEPKTARKFSIRQLSSAVKMYSEHKMKPVLP